MTAEMKCVLQMELNGSCHKRKEEQSWAVPSCRKNKSMRFESCPRLSGKVSTDRLTKGASVSRNGKNSFYRTVLNTCLSFLNGRKKAVGNTIIKKYEVEWRIQAKDTGVKYASCDYPMPDSSLRVRLYFFFYHHSYSAGRSRMTAEMNCVLRMKLNGSWYKRKECNQQAVPDYGESGGVSRRKGQVWAETERTVFTEPY